MPAKRSDARRTNGFGGRVVGIVSLVASILFAVGGAAAHAGAADPDFHALNNGKLRFGGGAEASVNSFGNLEQPFYLGAGSTWYQLTYSSYPLDLAIGTGTGSGNWTGSTVVDNPVLAGQVIDTSGFTSTGPVGAGVEGYGTVVSTGTATVNGADLEVSNTYELGQAASFVRISTRVTNTSGSAVDNVNLWVGTRDDYVGSSDGPTKTRGDISTGSFVPIADPADPAPALQITSGAEGVLFYSTTPGTSTSIDSCCSFSNAYGVDPSASPISLTGDGSYALHLPVGDLADGAVAEIEWFYAAGALADLDDVIDQVAEAAAPSVPELAVGDQQLTVTWTEPTSADPIIDYSIRWSDDGGTTWTSARKGDAAAPLSYTITGLTNSVSYLVQVAAVTHPVDVDVVGDYSASSDPAAPALPPGAPTGVTGAVGDQEVTVSWSAPADDGGSAVTGYTVTADPDGATCSTGGATSCAVTGLTNGTAYTFTVVATNPAGDGPASAASDPATPVQQVVVPPAVPEPEPDPAPPAVAPLPPPPPEAMEPTPAGTVHRIYLTLFERVADEGGLAYWTDLHRSGTSMRTIVVGFLRSPEWREHHQDPRGEDLVRTLYETVLGRHPDPAGFAYWRALLEDGTLTESGLVLCFVDSPEMAARIEGALGLG
jgi:hypothetical protein